MTRILTVLLVALVVESIGVVFLSKGLKQIGEMSQINSAEIWRVVRAGATNPNVLLGVALEAAFFGALLYLLGRADVSLVWPLTSLGFVLTTAAARFVNGEHVSGLRWAGVLLIVLGAGLVSWSEKQKPASPPPNVAKLPASAR